MCLSCFSIINIPLLIFQVFDTAGVLCWTWPLCNCVRNCCWSCSGSDSPKEMSCPQNSLAGGKCLWRRDGSAPPSLNILWFLGAWIFPRQQEQLQGKPVWVYAEVWRSVLMWSEKYASYAPQLATLHWLFKIYLSYFIILSFKVLDEGHAQTILFSRLRFSINYY